MKHKLAYLTSEYPGISHTFIFREIQGLRDMGVEVYTASVRRPAMLAAMTQAEQQDAGETLYIKSSSPARVAGAHWRTFLRAPLGFLRMLLRAFGLTFHGPRSLFKGFFYFLEAGVLLQWMHEKQLTHVHVHFANPAATVAMLAACSGRIKFSLSVHGPDIFYHVDTAMLSDKFRDAVFVRCITHYCCSQCMRLLQPHQWKKLKLVRCGIDPAKYKTRPAPENAVPVILCVGRLVPAKGQHILLQALARLKQEGLRWRCVFVGGGPDRASLGEMAKDLNIASEITFTGAVGQDQVPEYYDKADVFVLASFAEGAPVVLMEAMAKGVACVSTRITGIPELISEGTSGLLATPGDVVDLSDKIRLLLKDETLRAKLGRQGRKEVLERYNLEQNIGHMFALFGQNVFSPERSA